jgi:hypothetical protein
MNCRLSQLCSGKDSNSSHLAIFRVSKARLKGSFGNSFNFGKSLIYRCWRDVRFVSIPYGKDVIPLSPPLRRRLVRLHKLEIDLGKSLLHHLYFVLCCGWYGHLSLEISRTIQKTTWKKKIRLIWSMVDHILLHNGRTCIWKAW